MQLSRVMSMEFVMVSSLSVQFYHHYSVVLEFCDLSALNVPGDIKCENVLVTSWNWLYLADFASFKPTYIPHDDPSDFSFFFDTGGRRRSYLAPEVGLSLLIVFYIFNSCDG